MISFIFPGNNRFSSRKLATSGEKKSKDDREEKFTMFKETKEIKLEAKGNHGARKEDVENINNNEKIDEPLMERSMC